MVEVTIIYGEQQRTVAAEVGSLLGDVVAASGFPLEQPCAGQGTCGKCKVLAEAGIAPPDEVERSHLSAGELELNTRLACRARVGGVARLVLAPIEVYTNKEVRHNYRYKRAGVPLGLAVDLGSTTVAAYLVTLDDGLISVGAAALNQQTIYGADLISRLAAAERDPVSRQRLRRLAISSISQAVDGLRLPDKIRQRIERVTVVGNVAMHHLLLDMPLDTIARQPFQPYARQAIVGNGELLGGIFSSATQVWLPPLIGGFVGSDALACLAAFDFDRAPGPMALIDLGTNGEVLVTDGKRLLATSTAAGPAFEGVYISCGTRAVEGAIVGARLSEERLELTTIGGSAPTGLAGSGLLSVVGQLRQVQVIEPSGRISPTPPAFSTRIDQVPGQGRRFRLAEQNNLYLTQLDVRELQKAKGAIRAALDSLLDELQLVPADLERLILTGSFGAQVDVEAVLSLGLLPPVRPGVVEPIPNGAALGAALFLSDDGFRRAGILAEATEQINLEQTPSFMQRYVDAMALIP